MQRLHLVDTIIFILNQKLYLSFISSAGMGSNDSKIAKLESIEPNWIKIQNQSGIDIYRHTTDGIIAEKRSIIIDPRYSLDKELQIYGQRKNNHDSLVRSYVVEKYAEDEVAQKKKIGCNFCSQTQKVHVLTERIPVRFAELPQITFAQSILFLQETLKAYEKIYEMSGPLHINGELFGINEKGQVRAWLNENWAKNHPSHQIPTLKSAIQPNREYESINPQLRDQSEMIKNLINVIEEKNQEGIFPPKFNEELRSTTTFRQARSFLNNFVIHQFTRFVPETIKVSRVTVQKSNNQQNNLITYSTINSNKVGNSGAYLNFNNKSSKNDEDLRESRAQFFKKYADSHFHEDNRPQAHVNRLTSLNNVDTQQQFNKYAEYHSDNTTKRREEPLGRGFFSPIQNNNSNYNFVNHNVVSNNHNSSNNTVNYSDNIYHHVPNPTIKTTNPTINTTIPSNNIMKTSTEANVVHYQPTKVSFNSFSTNQGNNYASSYNSISSSASFNNANTYSFGSNSINQLPSTNTVDSKKDYFSKYTINESSSPITPQENHAISYSHYSTLNSYPITTATHQYTPLQTNKYAGNFDKYTTSALEYYPSSTSNGNYSSSSYNTFKNIQNNAYNAELSYNSIPPSYQASSNEVNYKDTLPVHNLNTKSTFSERIQTYIEEPRGNDLDIYENEPFRKSGLHLNSDEVGHTTVEVVERRTVKNQEIHSHHNQVEYEENQDRLH